MGKSPLLADFIHTRACKPICAKLLTLPKPALFRSEPSEVSKTERMKFIAIKTDDGIKGKLAFYCHTLHVSHQGFYKYLSVKDRPWKYQALADTMLEIHAADVCNDTYGRVRMLQALRPDGIPIPSERTVYRVMENRSQSSS